MSDEPINDLLTKKSPVEIYPKAKFGAVAWLVISLFFLLFFLFESGADIGDPESSPSLFLIGAVATLLLSMRFLDSFLEAKRKLHKGITDEGIVEAVSVIKKNGMTGVLSDHVREHGELSWENWADLMQSLNQECKRRYADSIAEDLRLAGRLNQN